MGSTFNAQLPYLDGGLTKNTKGPKQIVIIILSQPTVDCEKDTQSNLTIPPYPTSGVPAHLVCDFDM